ncbi:SRPBCC family protein [Streptomyces jumonjinensis]|uniref:SRPBCC family protein n=1 Tax=Streptomyces jumonjinensis TaxID=1945 RepID=A0A646KDJ7_STRJU|nr:SRPBCC family protein [Streptomyces jumonjinensis]MQT00067.1 SRPBCC family protein [Streptomyces jumonjinensis]
MSAFRLRRAVALPVGESWRRVTDWRAHAARMPLTALVSASEGPTRAGTVFTVRSAVGPVGVDDPMEVVRWEPPDGDGTGRCRLVKRGRTIRGWAEISVRPSGTGSVVVWVEELRIRAVPGVLDPVVARLGRWMFGRALDGLLGDGH